MSQFDEYAHYYDLFYRDKDYESEAGYIDELIVKYSPQAQTIFDMGCGTGRHDELLAQKGYIVHGIDMSAHMLDCAIKKTIPNKLTFSLGRIQGLDLQRRFDVVISLFHVMSYQVSNADIIEAFATARRHLNPGGIFIFDFWYGPAVLQDKPVTRVKRIKDGDVTVMKVAEPEMMINKNMVDVRYELVVRNTKNGKTSSFCENHRMRYFFLPEIELMLSNSGFAQIASHEFMTSNEPGTQSWNACVIARAK